MEFLRNLTYQETLILKAITSTTSMPLNVVVIIYKVVQSFDKTIAVINEAMEWGEDVEILAQEMFSKKRTIIDKIEE